MKIRFIIILMMAVSTAFNINQSHAAQLEIKNNTISVLASGTEITVRWATNLDSDTDAAWGKEGAYYGAGIENRCDGKKNTTSHCIVIRNLKPLTKYVVYPISCLNPNTRPCASGKATYITTGKDSSPPTNPPMVEVRTTKPNGVQLELSGGSDNVAVVGYNVYRDDKKIAKIPVKTSRQVTKYHDGTAVPNTLYVYKISSYDANGLESKKMTVVKVATPKLPPSDYPPSSPSTIHINPGVFCCKAELSWESGRDDKGVNGYKIFRNDKFLADTKETRYIDMAVKTGETYTYFIKTIDTTGNLSEPSSKVKTTIPPVKPNTVVPPSTIEDKNTKIIPPVTKSTTKQIEKIAKALLLTPDKKLEGIQEGDKISFKTELLMSDESLVPITLGVKWTVVGNIGKINPDGFFEAILLGDATEYGEANGSVIATYTDEAGKLFIANSPIFKVEAFVPEATDFSGSIFRAFQKFFSR